MWASLRVCAEIDKCTIHAATLTSSWWPMKGPHCLQYAVWFPCLSNEKWKIGVTYWNSLGLSVADDSIERNACEVRLRDELKKWSSHLLDNLRDCLILCTLKKFYFTNISFTHHFIDGNTRALHRHCGGHGFESHLGHLKFFSCICETITEIVQQMWGSFLQLITVFIDKIWKCHNVNFVPGQIDPSG